MQSPHQPIVTSIKGGQPEEDTRLDTVHALPSEDHHVEDDSTMEVISLVSDPADDHISISSGDEEGVFVETTTSIYDLTSQEEGNDPDDLQALGMGPTLGAYSFFADEGFPFDPLQAYVQSIFNAFAPSDLTVHLAVVPDDPSSAIIPETTGPDTDPFEDEASAWRDRFGNF
ncbi:hypothetical protein FRC17_008944 [Serendipita sp. 399]|nr:hypothetical protein FRC17_008944 [Serendipita sp. 399]